MHSFETWVYKFRRDIISLSKVLNGWFFRKRFSFWGRSIVEIFSGFEKMKYSEFVNHTLLFVCMFVTPFRLNGLTDIDETWYDESWYLGIYPTPLKEGSIFVAITEREYFCSYKYILIKFLHTSDLVNAMF